MVDLPLQTVISHIAMQVQQCGGDKTLIFTRDPPWEKHVKPMNWVFTCEQKWVCHPFHGNLSWVYNERYLGRGPGTGGPAQCPLKVCQVYHQFGAGFYNQSSLGMVYDWVYHMKNWDLQVFNSTWIWTSGMANPTRPRCAHKFETLNGWFKSFVSGEIILNHMFCSLPQSMGAFHWTRFSHRSPQPYLARLHVCSGSISEPKYWCSRKRPPPSAKENNSRLLSGQCFDCLDPSICFPGSIKTTICCYSKTRLEIVEKPIEIGMNWISSVLMVRASIQTQLQL